MGINRSHKVPSTKEIDICLRINIGMLKAGGSIFMKEINAFSLHQQKI